MKPLELKTADTTVQGTSNGSSRDSTTLQTVGTPSKRMEAAQASLTSKSVKQEFITSNKKSKKKKKQSRDTSHSKTSPRKENLDKVTQEIVNWTFDSCSNLGFCLESKRKPFQKEKVISASKAQGPALCLSMSQVQFLVFPDDILPLTHHDSPENTMFQVLLLSV